MRDQYDAQLWIDHHDQFSRWIGGSIRSLAGAIGRVLADRPAGAQLLAATVATSLTLLTFTASAV
ncbi:hypothetical protein E2493_11725 [Sphingomonas parva]|uniref:Uncharacterized protein n=1 Tax=Sphingomonas parva TaxID=2555898 RepID=A0A4Y8ZSG7_9SPHN|nr:hypothetical protein [Sphingomonas parva]TFI58065.1 hypothetical protein E2493_11725 [Sphingomonas parva]